jgi:glutamate--cysteine ligase
MTGRILRDFEGVHGYANRVCFKTGPPGRVGAELEWLVYRDGDLHQVVPLEELQALLAGPLPAGSRITFEPGGQVELSSPVASSLEACCAGLQRDLDCLTTWLAGAGLRILPSALDLFRPPRRQVQNPRYDAMQRYFDRAGPAGAVMMNSTASIQVNLDIGANPADAWRRWTLLNAIGPALLAAFANSPIHAGRPTGWVCSRQRSVQALDRSSAPAEGDPVAAWARYAWDAEVMLLRRAAQWIPVPGFTFGEWVSGATGYDRPTEDDLEYHLTTLFPPVRPRGWFEVRYLDAQPVTLWPVPVAVVTALSEDPVAADAALEAAEGTRHRWLDAARHGLGDAELWRAARRCFEIALEALRRGGGATRLSAAVENYSECYLLRRRTCADDRLTELSTSVTDLH